MGGGVEGSIDFLIQNCVSTGIDDDVIFVRTQQVRGVFISLLFAERMRDSKILFLPLQINYVNYSNERGLRDFRRSKFVVRIFSLDQSPST